MYFQLSRFIRLLSVNCDVVQSCSLWLQHPKFVPSYSEKVLYPQNYRLGMKLAAEVVVTELVGEKAVFAMLNLQKKVITGLVLQSTLA